MRIAVIGTGYVGLVTGTGLADFGNEVICADCDRGKVERLRKGEVPFYEPDLQDMVARIARTGRLRFTDNIGETAREAEVIFLAVGTPQGDEGRADLGQVFSAAKAVGQALRRDGAVVVTKSTVPVGTTERVREVIQEVTTCRFSVASNPEFLKEGDAVRDFMRPDRVVIGTDDNRARDLLCKLYGPFVRVPERILSTDIRSAELIKYASNAMLATRISFMNEMAALCEAVGADVTAVRHGVGTDSRIGTAFLYAGLGFGGSCFGKDLSALCATAEGAGMRLDLCEAARRRNALQREQFYDKIVRHFGGQVRGRTVAVWGLSFKPETDDLRDAPALSLIERFLGAGATVQAADPVANVLAHDHFAQRIGSDEGLQQAAKPLPDADRVLPLSFHDDPYEAAAGAEALILCTEWRAFRQPDWTRLRQVMRGTALFDGRNVWDPQAARAAGFSYCGVGRPG